MNRFWPGSSWPRTVGPSALTFFIRRKYGGASGMPFSSVCGPLGSSGFGCSAALKRRSKPSVEERREPMALPHSEPAPWAGKISVKSGSGGSVPNTLS